MHQFRENCNLNLLRVKQIASILLLAILLYNWVGYRLVSSYLENKSNITLEARLDNNNYNESDLIELSVPLDLPYQTNWAEFERFDGEIQIDGIEYKYVKRKISNGRLVILCLPHKEKMNLQTARDEFFRLVNDLDQAGNGHGTDSKPSLTSFKSITTDYWHPDNAWAFSALRSVSHAFFVQNERYTHFTASIPPAQPPDRA